jgi:hypothetical protein
MLRALYELAQLDCPAHAGALARALQPEHRLRPSDVARVLLVLDARGLVSAERARLTLQGLAEAARCPPLGLEQASWLPQLKRQAFLQRYAERAGGQRARG